MNEFRIELQDDFINFMGLAAPKEIEFLNFYEVTEKFSVVSDLAVHVSYLVEFTLSDRIVVQQRVVYDIFMMFGEVGGLNDFLVLVLASIFGPFSEKFLQVSLIEKLF